MFTLNFIIITGSEICRGVHSVSQLEEFTNLFMALSSVSLNGQNDEIRWIWTTNGKYFVSSAYECQILGAMTFFRDDDIWKACTEPKCKIFSWLVMHDRVLIADNMSRKNWPCDPRCSLSLLLHSGNNSSPAHPM
jgi:hypothetical protein